MAKRKQAPEQTPEGLEAPRRTRRQKQASSADVEQQQQTAVRSTRSRARQQQVQQQTDSQAAVLDDPYQQPLQEQQSDDQQDEQQQELDDFLQDSELAASVALVQGLLQQAEDTPVALVRPNPGMADATRRATKALLQYAISSSNAAKAAASQADGQQQQQQQQQQEPPDSAVPMLQQLHTGEGFDAEQVWLQMELLLNPLLQRTRKLVRQLLAQSAGGEGPLPQLLEPDVAAKLDELLQEVGTPGGSEDEGDEEGLGGSDDYGRQGFGMLGGDGDDDMEEEEGDEDLEHEAAAGSKQQRRQKQKPKQPAGVEDRFLNLDDMEAFLQQAERQAAADEDDEQDDDEDEEGKEEEDSEPSADEGDIMQRRQQRRPAGTAAAAAAADSDEEEAMLEQLLDSTAALAGKGKGSSGAAAAGKKGKKGAAAAVDGDAIMYEDFFGADGGDSDADMGDAAAAGAGSEDGSDWSIEGGEEQEEEGEEGSEEEGAGRQLQKQQQKRGGVMWDDDADDDGGSDEEEEPLSTHEKRLLRMQERIAELEAEAMGDRPWQLKGEVAAVQRPLNSALEVDMDYENLHRPPPAPTEEATTSLEDMIKKRIAENRWDDVVRVLPPAPEVKRKQLLELDDTKAQQGLGEVYEQEFVKAATGFSAPDKQDGIRQQAASLFKALCAKLDALSSFTYTPKPVVTELEVRSDVAALALEEVAPLAVSTATLAAPSEVYKAAAPGGEGKAEQELSRDERKRRRSKKKRVHKAKEAAKDSEAAARAAAAGEAGALVGRKSLAKQLAAATSSGLIKKGVVGAGGGDKSHKSTAMFGKLAAAAAAGADGKSVGGAKKSEGKKLKSSAVKL